MNKSRQFSLVRGVVFASLTLLLGACASADHAGPGGSPMDANNDPYENVNRKIWAFDLTLDRYILKPVAIAYRDVTPDFMREAIGNVLRNLKTPTIMMNNLLQGDFDHLGDNSLRLVMNTVLGLGGFIDVGAHAHIPYSDADFGQTLGSWGVDSGPYLVLPLLGPSDPRDAVGYGIDSVADPFTIEMSAHNYDYATYARTGVSIIQSRSESIDELDDLQRNSLDFYAAVRSLYQQRRAGVVQAARQGTTAPLPSIINQEDSGSPVPTESPTPSSSSGKAN